MRMRTALKVGCALGVLGCGATAHAPVQGASAFRPGWYSVRVPSATLIARRPDGSPWHVSAPDNTTMLLGGLLGLAAGSPDIGLAIGQSMSSSGGDPLAPAPFIVLKVEGDTYRIAPVGTTYAPNWTQPIAIDARHRTGEEVVVLQVRDAIDSSVIAQEELPLGQLLGGPGQTLTHIGGIATLDIAVAPLPARELTEFTVSVPSTKTLKELLTTGAPGWIQIPVWNGDRVTVTAQGSVCPSSPSECFGPAGAEPGRWQGYSYPEFADLPHASLVALAPGQHFGVGAGHTMTMSESGHLFLFVNDTDVGNNSGTLDVRVLVSPAQR